MRLFRRAFPLFLLGLSAGIAAAGEQKVVIPFDFESKFDDGRYGQMVGDMIWKKLDREKGFIIPETMLDVRDFCESQQIQPTPATPVDKMRSIVEDDFGAHIGIWGSVERAPGHEGDVYDLVIKCVDFSAEGGPKVIYETSSRTKTVSEIPHLYVKQMLDKLYGREPGGPAPIDALAEKAWQENPNLVTGGDFERGVRGVPTGWNPGWEAGDVDQYERLGNVVKWLPEHGNPQNRVIRFTLSKGLGDSTGVAYYSKGFFPIEEGAKYRFQCRWRSNGPKVVVFIKCYDEIDTVYRREGERPAAAPGMRSTRYIPKVGQVREVYRSQQNCYGEKNAWNTQTEDFTPKHTKYTPRWGRVMLYAYLDAGVVEFDDVVVKQIVPPSPGSGAKERRHSLDTGVTIKEMEAREKEE